MAATAFERGASAARPIPVIRLARKGMAMVAAPKTAILSIVLALTAVACGNLAARADEAKGTADPSVISREAEQKLAVERAAAREAKTSCITDESGFRQKDGENVYVITLTNRCERPQRCTLNVYLVTAFGPQQGKATLRLAGRAKGAAAQKSYIMQTKSAGGSVTASRSCTPL
jgi:hypothetical protein